MPSLYDELGVAPNASDEALRAGYRQRARQLHPDVVPGGDEEAMRRLNLAWAILGDPEKRRRYDQALAAAGIPVGAGAPAPAPAKPPGPHGIDDGRPKSRNADIFGVAPNAAASRRVWFLRPWALVLAALATLFVVTAYAGSWPGNDGGAPASTPSTAAGSAGVHPIGQCLAATGSPELNILVPCTAPNAGQILAEVASVDQCPTGTVGRLWSLRPTVLCTTEPPGP